MYEDTCDQYNSVVFDVMNERCLGSSESELGMIPKGKWES